MKSPKNLTENSPTERLSQLLQIYSGISGQIYKSDVETSHKALYGLSFPVALGFGLLALCGAPWYGYAFFAGLMTFFASIITKQNERKNKWQKDEAESRAQQDSPRATRACTNENSLSLDY